MDGDERRISILYHAIRLPSCAMPPDHGTDILTRSGIVRVPGPSRSSTRPGRRSNENARRRPVGRLRHRSARRGAGRRQRRRAHRAGHGRRAFADLTRGARPLRQVERPRPGSAHRSQALAHHAPGAGVRPRREDRERLRPLARSQPHPHRRGRRRREGELSRRLRRGALVPVPRVVLSRRRARKPDLQGERQGRDLWSAGEGRGDEHVPRPRARLALDSGRAGSSSGWTSVTRSSSRTS